MTESFWRVSIDQTTPEIAATITPPANAAGWHNSDPTLSFACSDALSGVLSCSEPIVVTTEGQTQSFTGSAIDNADNSRDVGVSINLDKPRQSLPPRWNHCPIQRDGRTAMYKSVSYAAIP